MTTVRAPAPSLRIARLSATFRPYAYHLALAVFLPGLLLADARVANTRQQLLLGVATAAFLFVATRYSPPAERRMVWLAVAMWAVVEVFASRVWGIYTYRFGNTPLFVPFGHGALYLCGLRAARTPALLRHGAALRRAALGLAVGWAALGVSVLPAVTGRWDVAGAALLPAFVYGLRRSRAATLYAALFFAASLLEVAGTAFGTWTWAATQPVTLLPSGNPPSVVATAYCLFDWLLARSLRRAGLLDGAQPPPDQAAPNPQQGIAFS